MIKIVFFTVLMAVSLVCNKKIFMKSGGCHIGYWMFSFIGILGCALTFLDLNTSLNKYLTQFIKPIFVMIFGGSV